MLSKGCNVVLADLSLRPEAKALLEKHEGPDKSPRAIFVETDVTSWPALGHMFDATLQEFGSFDILCPGAGVYEPSWSSFWHPPGSKESKDAVDAGHYALLDINLTHPIRATQMAMSHWLYPQEVAGSKYPVPEKVSPSNQKRIIHIASVASQVPVFRAPLYGASKFAISGFVRCVGPLDAYGIKVNAVAPGLVRTPLWIDNPDKLGNVDESKDTWVTPEEVAEAMLGCVESEATASGAVIEVGASHTREVNMFNDPGPNFTPEAGMISSNSEHGNTLVHDSLGNSATWKPQ